MHFCGGGMDFDGMVLRLMLCEVSNFRVIVQIANQASLKPN